MPSPKADLRVQVIDDEIIVTRPGSSFAVTYYKPEDSPQLLAKRIADHDDSMTAAEFFAQAWRLANDKAREPGLDCVSMNPRWPRHEHRPGAGAST